MTAADLIALPRLIVHTAAHVAAARALGVPVIVQSPPDCPRRQGVPWFAALVTSTAPPLLPVLDCGDAPGLALAALRLGLPAVRLEPGPAAAAVAAVAAELGAVVDTGAPAALLDLQGQADPAAACRRFLGLA
ncbi:hypothetical protein [Caenispirillum bisanense]|uniref:hypothetical protein n=1 Tax=Caenispirillum bisanense TaxID=414052 RepID=UPI0031D6D3A1